MNGILILKSSVWLTPLSPRQLQERLRLSEASGLMLNGKMDAATFEALQQRMSRFTD